MIFGTTGAKPRLIIEAVVIKACQSCGDSRIRDGKYVEGECPSCGAQLTKVEDKGVIFDSKWRNSWLGRLQNGISEYINKQRR